LVVESAHRIPKPGCLIQMECCIFEVHAKRTKAHSDNRTKIFWQAKPEMGAAQLMQCTFLNWYHQTQIKIFKLFT